MDTLITAVPIWGTYIPFFKKYTWPSLRDNIEATKHGWHHVLLLSTIEEDVYKLQDIVGDTCKVHFHVMRRLQEKYEMMVKAHNFALQYAFVERAGLVPFVGDAILCSGAYDFLLERVRARVDCLITTGPRVTMAGIERLVNFSPSSITNLIFNHLAKDFAVGEWDAPEAPCCPAFLFFKEKDAKIMFSWYLSALYLHPKRLLQCTGPMDEDTLRDMSLYNKWEAVNDSSRFCYVSVEDPVVVPPTVGFPHSIEVDAASAARYWPRRKPHSWIVQQPIVFNTGHLPDTAKYEFKMAMMVSLFNKFVDDPRLRFKVWELANKGEIHR